jgi:hypothetical protein
MRDAVRGANAAATGCGQLFGVAPRLCATPMTGAARADAAQRPPTARAYAASSGPSPSGCVPEVSAGGGAPGGGIRASPRSALPGARWTSRRSRGRCPSKGGRRTLSSLTRTQRHHRTGGDRSENATLSRRQRRDDSLFLDSSIPPPPPKIILCEGWSVNGHPSGFCDGTSNSVCGRQKSSNCLMSGHNDGRGAMEVDALSGWQVLQLADVTEGLFMAWVVNAIIAMQKRDGACPART